MNPTVMSSFRATVAAHLFGITAIILMLVWLLHYRGGLDLHSSNEELIFNVHPFMMFSGFIFLAGEAMMAYKTVLAQRKVQKVIHMMIHLVALSLGIVGIFAAFKYHEQLSLENMYSLHSWIGMGTICLYGLQWLAGFVSFWFSRPSTRERVLPWHVYGGRALLYMTICAALSGLMEKATLLNLNHGHESHLINFTGLFILLFGIAVDFSIALSHYVSIIIPY